MPAPTHDPASGDLGATIMGAVVAATLVTGVVVGLMLGSATRGFTLGLIAATGLSFLASILVCVRVPPRDEGASLRCGYPCGDLDDAPCPECGSTARASTSGTRHQ
ncbi:MAG: hypothetical protein KDA28_11005 [Phycisphaerales bacterium]|nr:hypothetical protein [Phycisphaerales bacterium]